MLFILGYKYIYLFPTFADDAAGGDDQVIEEDEDDIWDD
jgi:hypothetical protein